MNPGHGRILIVDDKPSMVQLLARILGDHHEVTTAPDGSAALAVVGNQEFDVILSDIRMPGADGFEVVRTVRNRWPQTEIILMTAYASIESAVVAVKQGAYDYIQKPFDPDDVALVVARALEFRRSRAQELSGPSGHSTREVPITMSFKDAVNLARERSAHEYLIALMRTFNGNVTQASDRAGIERESLHRLLRRYDLRAEDYRDTTEKAEAL